MGHHNVRFHAGGRADREGASYPVEGGAWRKPQPVALGRSSTRDESPRGRGLVSRSGHLSGRQNASRVMLLGRSSAGQAVRERVDGGVVLGHPPDLGGLPIADAETWVYFHSALDPSWAVAFALPSTTTCSSLPRMSWISTALSVAWAWRGEVLQHVSLPSYAPAHLLLPPTCQTTSSARCSRSGGVAPLERLEALPDDGDRQRRRAPGGGDDGGLAGPSARQCDSRYCPRAASVTGTDPDSNGL
jgi:hypothetical protein